MKPSERLQELDSLNPCLIRFLPFLENKKKGKDHGNCPVKEYDSESQEFPSGTVCFSLVIHGKFSEERIKPR